MDRTSTKCQGTVVSALRPNLVRSCREFGEPGGVLDGKQLADPVARRRFKILLRDARRTERLASARRAGRPGAYRLPAL